MKKLLSIVLAVLMVVTLIPVGVFAATSATGTITATAGWYESEISKSEMIIDSVEDLWAFMEEGKVKNYEGKTVKLACDLDLNEGWNAGSRLAAANLWTPIANFKGVFDGQGYEIKGLCIVGGSNLGFVSNLFGTIKNLALVNALVKATGNAIGSFAAHMEGASCLLSNVYTDALVIGDMNVGGLTYGGGSANSGVMLEKCWFNGLIDAKGNYTSGLYGNQEHSVVTIVDCLNTGAVYSNGNSAGISTAVYNGALHATNVVNLGPVQRKASANRGVDTGAITNTLGSGAGSAEGTASKQCNWTNVYALEGTAGSIYPYDMRGSSTIVMGGVNYTRFPTDNRADLATQMTITKADIANEAAYAGLDFANTWTMTAKGPVLKSFSEYSIINYISNVAELKAWAADATDDTGTTTRLASDIVVRFADTVSGNDSTWTRKAALKGTFDGMGLTISGIRGNNFIGDLYGTLRNLSLTEGVFVDGSFAYILRDGALMENLYTNSVVRNKANQVGGFAATRAGSGSAPGTAATIRNCWFDGEVATRYRYASGFVGDQCSRATIYENCLNTGLVASNAGGSTTGEGALLPNNNICVAGISSAVYGGAGTVFTNCVNLGKIVIYNREENAEVASKIANNLYHTGGIAGNVTAAGNVTYNNCYVLEGTCNFAAMGSIGGADNSGTDYNANVKMLTPAQVDEFVISGWAKTRANNGSTVMAPGVFNGFSAFAVSANAKPATVIEIGNYDELWAAMGGKSYTIPVGTEFRLTGDIDMNGKTWADLNVEGVFNGNGYAIKNFSTDAFFNTVGTNGIIKNVKLLNGKATHGGVAYKALGGARFENVYSNTKVNEGLTQVAVGFVFSIENAKAGAAETRTVKPVTFIGCWLDGEINVRSDARYVSGFVGNQQSSPIDFIDCLSTATLKSAYASSNFMWAAFSGSIYSGINTFENCVNMQTIASNASGVSYGITLRLEGNVSALTIENCYNLTGSYETKGSSENGHADQRQIGMAQDIATKAELANCGLDNWAYNSVAGHMVPAFFADADNKYDVAPYKAAGTYPVKEGYVFAGWFTDAACTVALGTGVTTGTAYAKFVDEDVLSIGAQIRNKDAEKASVRFISTVDSLDYTNIGFEVVFGKSDVDTAKKAFSKTSTSVYKALVSGGSYTDPGAFAEDGEYFFAYTINNVPASYFDTAIGVRATWTTLDGTVVTSNYTGIATINTIPA